MAPRQLEPWDWTWFQLCSPLAGNSKPVLRLLSSLAVLLDHGGGVTGKGFSHWFSHFDAQKHRWGLALFFFRGKYIWITNENAFFIPNNICHSKTSQFTKMGWQQVETWFSSILLDLTNHRTSFGTKGQHFYMFQVGVCHTACYTLKVSIKLTFYTQKTEQITKNKTEQKTEQKQIVQDCNTSQAHTLVSSSKTSSHYEAIECKTETPQKHS